MTTMNTADENKHAGSRKNGAAKPETPTVDRWSARKWDGPFLLTVLRLPFSRFLLIAASHSDRHIS